MFETGTRTFVGIKTRKENYSLRACLFPGFYIVPIVSL